MTRFLPDGLLDMFDPSLPGRPERTLGFGSDLHACPASHSPGRGAGSPGHRWPVPIPALARALAGPIHGSGRPLPPSHRAGYYGAYPSVIDHEPPEG